MLTTRSGAKAMQIAMFWSLLLGETVFPAAPSTVLPASVSVFL